MNPECQGFEELLSAHLDGELAPEAAVAALEHALGCAACRAFFDESRRLESRLAAVDDPVADAPEVLERLWTAVRRRSGWGGAGGAILRGRWFLAVAAVFVAAVALWLWLAPGAARSPSEQLVGRPPAGATDTAPGTAARAMTDERFVAMARELLAADPRYLRAMEGVLREASAPSEGGSGEDQPVRGEGAGLMPPRGAV